jgi:hypothetical protein
MTDIEVAVWVRGIFDVRYVRLQQYLVEKLRVKEKEAKGLVNLSTQEE